MVQQEEKEPQFYEKSLPLIGTNSIAKKQPWRDILANGNVVIKPRVFNTSQSLAGTDFPVKSAPWQPEEATQCEKGESGNTGGTGDIRLLEELDAKSRK